MLQETFLSKETPFKLSQKTPSLMLLEIIVPQVEVQEILQLSSFR